VTRALALLLIAACATAPRGVKEDVVDEAWREILSPDVRLITDADAPIAYAWFAVMDIGARILARRFQALVPGTPATHPPITVILVEDCARLTEIGLSEKWSGRTGDLRGDPLVVTCGSSGDRPLGVAMRELAHLLQQRTLGPLPPWIDEAMATFHGATRILPRQVATGFLLPEEQAALLEVRGRLKLADIRPLRRDDLLARPDALALGRLFMQTFAASSDEERRRLTLYLRALAADASDAEAWAAAFDDLSETAVDDRLTETTAEDLAFANTEPRTEGPPPAPDVRRLSDAEALLWWGQLVVATGRSTDVITRQLAAAARAGASHVEVARLRAAAGILAAPAAGGDADSLAAFVQLRLAQLVTDPLAGLDGKPVRGVDDLEPEAKQLARLAQTPSQLAAVARYFALIGLPQVALGFAVRALDLDRGCSPCRDGLALVLWQLGRKPEARRHQRRLLDAADATAAMAARARAYR
jgi:hypothetical protein